MKPILITIAMLILCSLTFGQNTNCPEQEYLTWDSSPVVIDPNMIAIHPISGQPLYLGEVMVELGREWSYDFWPCDEDGDAMTVTVDHGSMVVSTGNVYTVRATETSIGVKYVNISAATVPALPSPPVTVTGTLAIIVTPKDHAPVLCGGRP